MEEVGGGFQCAYSNTIEVPRLYIQAICWVVHCVRWNIPGFTDKRYGHGLISMHQSFSTIATPRTGRVSIYEALTSWGCLRQLVPTSNHPGRP